MTAMQPTIIRLQNLSKTYGNGENAVHALNDINLDIKQGEIFGVIGLSGAGKSTLVRCINYLERPTAGEVIVDKQELGKLSHAGNCQNAEKTGRAARAGVAGNGWSG